MVVYCVWILRVESDFQIDCFSTTKSCLTFLKSVNLFGYY